MRVYLILRSLVLFKRIEEKKQKKNFQRELDLAIGLEMERFAEANYYHFKSIPELRKIAGSKINPDYKDTNSQQQAGFSAEVKQTARTNAQNAIDGKAQRIERTDNVGDVNYPQYDHVNVDKNGNPILDHNGKYTGGSQQKNFSKIENYDKLRNKDYEHYKDTPIDVPSDHYDQIMEKWNNDRNKLVKQEQHLRDQGRIEEADNINAKIEKLDDTSKRLRKSNVSSEDAMEARKNYRKSVAKDIAKNSHKAGIDAAQKGALIGGAMSTVGNTKALIDGDIDIEEAFTNISIDTAKSATKSYATAASSAAVGGALKASNKQILNNLAKKNGPTAIVATGTMLTKETIKLVSGKVSPEEYAQNIGKEGFSLASSLTGSNIGAIVGTAIFPGVGTAVGGFIGGMVASMLSSATHAELMRTIQDTKLSEEKRKIISEYCNKLKQEEIQYRREMISTFNQFFSEKEQILGNGFESISNALANGESINNGLEEVGRAFGIKLAFSSTV